MGLVRLFKNPLSIHGLSVSVDHGLYNQQNSSDLPEFLSVISGMTVIVKCDFLVGEKQAKNWWIGQLIHCGSAASNPSIHNLFQIAELDSGVIRWVNADLATH